MRLGLPREHWAVFFLCWLQWLYKYYSYVPWENNCSEPLCEGRAGATNRQGHVGKCRSKETSLSSTEAKREHPYHLWLHFVLELTMSKTQKDVTSGTVIIVWETKSRRQRAKRYRICRNYGTDVKHKNEDGRDHVQHKCLPDTLNLFSLMLWLLQHQAKARERISCDGVEKQVQYLATA